MKFLSQFRQQYQNQKGHLVVCQVNRITVQGLISEHKRLSLECLLLPKIEQDLEMILVDTL